MTKRKLIIHGIVFLFIFLNAIPVLKNGLATTTFWIAIVLAVILLIADIVRLVKRGIIE